MTRLLCMVPIGYVKCRMAHEVLKAMRDSRRVYSVVTVPVLALHGVADFVASPVRTLRDVSAAPQQTLTRRPDNDALLCLACRQLCVLLSAGSPLRTKPLFLSQAAVTSCFLNLAKEKPCSVSLPPLCSGALVRKLRRVARRRRPRSCIRISAWCVLTHAQPQQQKPPLLAVRLQTSPRWVASARSLPHRSVISLIIARSSSSCSSDDSSSKRCDLDAAVLLLPRRRAQHTTVVESGDSSSWADEKSSRVLWRLKMYS